ncbi:MAG: monofunctional biosynthetic peptidoglycan transglycosylase [Sphingobacteriia bacterium]|nr:MAG: monofunctional biosynthetic peptidoglycan transglycosylase [Sphingobacteriia bacterium]
MMKTIGKILLWAFLSSLLYVLVCKWIMPPITLTQLANWPQYGLSRDYVGQSGLSPHLQLAAIASEDQTFTDHSGFDWDAMEKSLRPKKKGKKSRIPPGGGASTITQQTAKNVFLWQGGRYDKYLRKALEFYFTFLIEKVWGKERILTVYLNVIEMGPGIFGAEAAAQKYFGKSAARLTRAEAAQIIACLPNPKKFTVKPLSRRVAWRSPQVLQQMNNLQDDPDVQALLKR